jgi:ribosomal protein S5
MRFCLVLPIPARWRNAALSAVAVVAAVAGVTFALAFSAGAATDPLSDLKAGADALDAGRHPAAIAALKGLPQRLPKLADYAA